MTYYLFSERTLKEIKRIVRLKEQRVSLDSWFKDEQIILSENEKQQTAYIVARLLPYETTLMNEATIWGRAIYPMLLMSENTVLFVKEYADEVERNYSFHWQDADNKLIVRWDNAHHHKHIKTYPHHKHIDETVRESFEISLNEVLSYIEQHERI